MEDTDVKIIEKPKKQWLKLLLIIVSFGLFIFGFYVFLVSTIREDVKTRIEHQQELDGEKFKNAFCTQKVDSLTKANADLSKYKALSQAMLHRDEATKQLSHQIGDVVILKTDSARVVIGDVIIGGGKYNYYVKFRVLYKDNTEKEVVPELIY